MSANKSASSRDADCIVREHRPEWAPWMTRKTLLAKPIHRWFTFPHSFTSELVYALIDDWGLSPRDRVLDPFVGAGTTVLAAKQRRIPARGYDISPLAQLVSRAKVADYQRSHLQVLLKVLCNAVASKRAQKAKCTGKSNFLAKALPGSRLRNFSLYVEAIDNLSCGSAERDFFKVALMAIVPAFSRARAAGGWLKWTGDHEEPGVFSEVFEDQVNKMLIDVEDQSSSLGQCWAVDAADARCIPDDDDTYTAVITSPPYPNRHDYTRVFGVELMVGFLTEAQTQRLRYESLRSHPEARVYTGEIGLSSNGCGWVEARSAGRRGVLAVHLTGGGRGTPWPGVGRSGVAAGRPACQRATRVLRCAAALRVTHRPSLRSSSRYGPCGPAWTGASRPSTTTRKARRLAVRG